MEIDVCPAGGVEIVGWGVRLSGGFVFSGLEFKRQCHPSASS